LTQSNLKVYDGDEALFAYFPVDQRPEDGIKEMVDRGWTKKEISKLVMSEMNGLLDREVENWNREIEKAIEGRMR
jgi:hypothetical protein